MPQLVSLNNNTHRTLKIDRSKIASVGAHERMIPVVLSEFLKLSVQYPIVFTKNAETGKFLVVALLGFEHGENLFWKNHQWDGLYVPLNITRQPFFIGKEDLSKEASVICIDLVSDCLSQEQGEAIFDAEGNETHYMESMRSTLAELLGGEKKTQTFIDSLLEHELIMPLSLDITFVNSDTQPVQGVYTIDEQKLENLPVQVITKLHKEKYLKLVYIMVASLGHIYALIQRKNERLAP